MDKPTLFGIKAAAIETGPRVNTPQRCGNVEEEEDREHHEQPHCLSLV